MNRTQSNIGTAVTLAVALLVAWVCSLNSLTISGIPLFGFCALIIFVIQYVIFIPSYLNQTEHFFDLTGSLTFISISILSVALSPNLSLINILLALMISIWAIRLGSFLFWRVRKDGEDKRFTIMKTKFSWFFMTWNVQGLWVLLSLGAALAAISSPKEVSFNVIHIFGFLIWLTGFLIEVIADNQKTKFRANLSLLKYAKKITKIPIIAIGGINSKNYKKLLLNKANFLAISGYIWKNKKLKPKNAIKKLI